MSAALPPDTHFDVESFVNPLEGWAVISADAHCPAGVSCPPPLPAGQLVETSDGGKTWRVAAAQ